MKDKKECRIIQDLLPSYMEGLTTEETNEYVEEHLKECDECRKTLETMQKDIEINTNHADKKEVNYFKKYKKKMTLLKGIILIILLVFIITVGRRMFILVTLSKKAEKSKESDNYYIRYSQYEGDSMTVTKTYKKGEKKLTILEYYDNENTEQNNKWTEFCDGNKTNIYVETKNEKIAMLDAEEGGILPPMLFAYSSVNIENVGQLIQNAILSSIRTIKCNGRECYYFSNFQSTTSRIGSEVGYRYLY